MHFRKGVLCDLSLLLNSPPKAFAKAECLNIHLALELSKIQETSKRLCCSPKKKGNNCSCGIGKLTRVFC